LGKAISSRPDVFEQANAVFQLLDGDERCKELGIRPDTITFNSLLSCLVASKSADVNFAQSAKTILEKMEQLASDGQTSVSPDVITWNLVLKACIKTGDIDLVNEMVERMEKSKAALQIKTYTEVLKFFSKDRKLSSANRAEQILTGMQNIAATRQPDIRPDVICYHVVMTAYENCGSAERMWYLYEQMIANNIRPDLHIYTTLIVFFSRSLSREYMIRATNLLQEMEQHSSTLFRPDFRHYVAVIRGWIRFSEVDRATDVLMQSVDAYLKGGNYNVLPRDWVILLILKSWIRRGDLLRATSLLNKLESLYSAGLPSPPSKRCYATLIEAWEKSKLPEKSEIVKELLQVQTDSQR
jgi:pentatricopeptide repeat protein